MDNYYTSKDSSGDDDEDPDDMDNMDDGLVGRYGNQTTRNGVTSATLSVRNIPCNLVTFLINSGKNKITLNKQFKIDKQ